MVKPRDWTQEQDDLIIKMRRDNHTWFAIAHTLNVSRNTVIERGRKLKAEKPTFAELQALKEDPGPVISKKENRGPLPAGHPIFWQLLCPHDDYPNNF